MGKPDDDNPARKGRAKPTGGASGYVCAKCGLPVALWHYGWKHSGGHGSPRSCGSKPEPVLARKGNI